MEKKTKKEIKEALDKLKEQPTSTNQQFDQKAGKLAPKQSSQRIRKQGTK